MDFFLQYVLVPLSTLLIGALGTYINYVFLPKHKKVKEEADNKATAIEKLLQTIDEMLIKYSDSQTKLIETTEKLTIKELEIKRLEHKVSELEIRLKNLEYELAISKGESVEEYRARQIGEKSKIRKSIKDENNNIISSTF